MNIRGYYHYSITQIPQNYARMIYIAVHVPKLGFFFCFRVLRNCRCSWIIGYIFGGGSNTANGTWPALVLISSYSISTRTCWIMSEDEFDNIPDDFAGISGADWDRVLPLAGPSSAVPASTEDQSSHLPGTGEHLPIPSISAFTSSSSSSTDNFEDDYDDCDPSFFAELDRIEGEFGRGKAIRFYIFWLGTPYLLFICRSRATTSLRVDFGLTAFSLLFRCVLFFFFALLVYPNLSFGAALNSSYNQYCSLCLFLTDLHSSKETQGHSWVPTWWGNPQRGFQEEAFGWYYLPHFASRQGENESQQWHFATNSFWLWRWNNLSDVRLFILFRR